MKIVFGINKIILIIFFAFCSAFANSIDSLETLLKNTNDSKRIELLNNLSIEYYKNEPDKFLKLSKQALKENEKINNKLERFVTVTNLAYFYVDKNDSSKYNQYNQYAYKILPEIADDEKSIAYYYLIRNYEKININDSIYVNALKAYKYSSKLNSDDIKIKILNSYAGALRERGNYSEAIKIAEEMQQLATEKNMLVWIAQSNALFGVILRDWKKYETSIQKLEKAVSILETYMKQTIITPATKIEYERYLFSYHNNLAIANSEINKLDEAVKHLLHARKYSERTKDKKSLAQVNANLGFIYYKRKLFDSAITYFNVSAKQAVELNAFDGAVINYSNISSAYQELKQYSQAINYSKIAYDYYKKNNLGYLNKLVYENLIQAFNLNNDFKNAFKYQSEYLTVKDSLYQKEAELKIADIYSQVELQNEKKEKELILKNQQNEKELLNSEKRNNLIIFALILLIAIVILVSNFFRLKSKSKLNDLLSEKNKEINIKNEELQEVIATKDKFFSIIAHDIRNPIASFMQLTDMIHRSYDNFENEEKKNYIGMMKDTAGNLFSLLVNLLEWSNAQRGNIKVKYSEFDFKFVIESVLRALKTTAGNKSIEIVCNYKSGLILNADVNLISTVVRNLVSNAIKFTKNNGKVEIFVEKMLDENGTEFANISVQDNGVGMSELQINKLFNIGESKSTLGTNKESGTGLGLILCKEFVELHSGKIWVESEVGKGSIFHFTLPLN